MGNHHSTTTTNVPKSQTQVLKKNSTAKPKMRQSRSDPVDMKRPTTKEQILTNFQKRQIKGSWMVAQKRLKQPIGERIFLRVFERNPEIKEVFNWEHIQSRQLANYEPFKKHTKNVQNKLQETVSNLDLLEDEIGCSLYELGRRHAEITSKKGQNRRQILSRYWDIFAESIIKCVTEGQSVVGLIAAWRILICWMTNRMRDGLMTYNVTNRLTTRRASEPSTMDWEMDFYHNEFDLVNEQPNQDTNTNKMATLPEGTLV